MTLDERMMYKRRTMYERRRRALVAET